MKFYFCTENQDTKFIVKNFKEALYIVQNIAEQYIWTSQYKTMSVEEFKKKIESEKYGELYDTHILWWLLKEEYDLALALKKEINDKHTTDYVDRVLQ